MNSSPQERILELVCRAMDAINRRMNKVSKQYRKALRREFQGWFCMETIGVEVIWLKHLQQWED